MGEGKQPLIQYFWLAMPLNVFIWTLSFLFLEQK